LLPKPQNPKSELIQLSKKESNQKIKKISHFKMEPIKSQSSKSKSIASGTQCLEIA